MPVSLPNLPRAFRRTEAASPPIALCLNCGELVETRFCPHCGQENEPLRLSFSQIFKEALEEFFKFDSKLVNTVVPLFIRPGELTREWASGRRMRYITPFKLYLTATFLFFLAASYRIPAPTPTNPNKKVHVRSATDMTDAPEQVRFFMNVMERIDEADQGTVLNGLLENMPKALFVLLPIFAFALKIIYIRSGRYYVEHLVFLLHNHAFLFLTLTLAEIVPGPASQGIAFLVCSVYFVLALKRYYRQGWPKTIIKGGMLAWAYLMLLACAIVAAIFLSAMAMPEKALPPETPKKSESVMKDAPGNPKTP